MTDHKCEFKTVTTRFLPDNKAEYWTSCNCGAITEPQSFEPTVIGVESIVYDPSYTNTGDPYETLEAWLDENHPDWKNYSPEKLVQIINDEY